MRITLVGMGSGAPGGLTVRGLAALQGAGLIIGARRLLQNLPDGCTDNRTALYKTDEICALLQEAGCEQAAVVFSGDPLYGGAGRVQRAAAGGGTGPPLAGLAARIGPRLRLRSGSCVPKGRANVLPDRRQ